MSVRMKALIPYAGQEPGEMRPRKAPDMRVVDVLLEAVLPEHRKAFERTISRVAVTDSGCWEWQGCRRERGYAVAHYRYLGRNLSPHRFVMLALGYDIEWLVVCHHCDNPPCINPAHLFIGTHTDNVRDCMAKGRFINPPVTDWPARMKDHPHHWQKISASDVPTIRARLASGEKLAAVAADYGVSFQAVSKIRTGTRWSHVP